MVEISPKQKQAIDLAFDPQVTELLWGGANGAGKTFVMCLICLLFVKKYPGVKIFIGRKTLKSLKQSTISSLIGKVHPAMGIGYGDYAMHFQDMTLDYANGSQIIFGELDYQPSDEDYSRMGSLEIDFGVIEEAGEVSEKAFSALKSRVGRGILAKEHDFPGFVMASCNPSRNWLKTRFYDAYEKLGGGEMQKWQIGNIEVAGESKPAYRCFVRATAYDNPFLPQSYIDTLNALPDKERKRAFGNWNYADDDDMLFKSGLLEKATTYELPQGSGFNKYIGCDIADKGKDRSVFTLIDNGVVTTQKIAGASIDKNSEAPIGRLLADELIEFAQKNGFTSKDARNIAIETNGVGASIRDIMKLRGWYFTEYVATHKSRSENYYQLMLDMDSGAIKLYHEMFGLDELEKELAGHTYQMKEQTPDVCKKDEIKQKIGRSPDLADSLCIAGFALHNVTDKKGDRFNQARVVF